MEGHKERQLIHATVCPILSSIYIYIYYCSPAYTRGVKYTGLMLFYVLGPALELEESLQVWVVNLLLMHTCIYLLEEIGLELGLQRAHMSV